MNTTVQAEAWAGDSSGSYGSVDGGGRDGGLAEIGRNRRAVSLTHRSEHRERPGGGMDVQVGNRGRKVGGGLFEGRAKVFRWWYLCFGEGVTWGPEWVWPADSQEKVAGGEGREGQETMPVANCGSSVVSRQSCACRLAGSKSRRVGWLCCDRSGKKRQRIGRGREGEGAREVSKRPVGGAGLCGVGAEAWGDAGLAGSGRVLVFGLGSWTVPVY